MRQISVSNLASANIYIVHRVYMACQPRLLRARSDRPSVLLRPRTRGSVLYVGGCLYIIHVLGMLLVAISSLYILIIYCLSPLYRCQAILYDMLYAWMSSRECFYSIYFVVGIDYWSFVYLRDFLNWWKIIVATKIQKKKQQPKVTKLYADE